MLSWYAVVNEYSFKSLCISLSVRSGICEFISMLTHSFSISIYKASLNFWIFHKPLFFMQRARLFSCTLLMIVWVLFIFTYTQIWPIATDIPAAHYPTDTHLSQLKIPVALAKRYWKFSSARDGPYLLRQSPCRQTGRIQQPRLDEAILCAFGFGGRNPAKKRKKWKTYISNLHLEDPRESVLRTLLYFLITLYTLN